MADENHNISTNSCQEETLNLICHEKTIPNCCSLTKSYSVLAYSSPAGSQTKPEIHKSLTSLLCVPKCNENTIQQSHSSDWSPNKDSTADHCSLKSNYNNLSVELVGEKIQHKNHYLSADSSLATTEKESTNNFVRYDVSENISLLGRSELSMFESEGIEMLDTPTVMVQKSYSDYCCSRRSSVPHSVRMHNKNSATFSNLSSSSSISGSGSDRTCNLSNVTQDSGIVHSPSNAQNNLTDAVLLDVHHNIPLCYLDSSAIQQNITVYAVPGVYQHDILGPRNSGNTCPNNEHVCSQSHYNIPSAMSCNISEAKLSLPAMIIHNSCSVHCCKGHESMMKVDDTISAYCHSMPISSVHFSNVPGHSFGDTGSLHAPPQLCQQLQLSDKFSFPKLASSVSESGLDAKKLIKCGLLTFPQPPISVEESNLTNSSIVNNQLLLKTIENPQEGLELPDLGAKMKDSWTMTSMNNLSTEQILPHSYKDAEVQTIIIMKNKSVSTTPCLQTTSHSHLEAGVGFSLQCPQSPMREVRWDDEGMTWEVYGAAVDPEVLGLAIQKHLEIQIEQHTQPSELSGETELSIKEKRRSFRTVIESIRQSNCCGRTDSTSE
ncbi:GRIN2-like protein [Hyperolius riggenbachi]|uniref:GRIN2-like protein n=1 Tax=Hyperolius riggenbachi TaxID=752182 RepID=UPI0035A2F0EB